MKTLHENTILLVDDTPENIEILVDLLDGFDLKVAINGKEALETAWEDAAPDLILLDIMMPEMDGYEACRRLRADERTKDGPVIFLTAKTQKDDVYKAFEAGGQDYVTKPFDARELTERVKTQLELKTQREALKDMNHILEEKVRQRTAHFDKANKELKVLDEAKTNFLMMISHELRTPLNGIVGATYFLNDSLSADNELAEFVDMLKTSVDRLEKFSTTALLITQLNTNQLISNEEVDFTVLVQEILANMADKFAAKNLLLQSSFTNESCLIKGQKDLLQMAVRNILDNAVKYSEANQYIDVCVEKSGSNIIATFRDKGKGFSQEALNHLFSSFGLGEKHYDQNLGLSLKAVKSIMDAHKAIITVQNMAGEGAEVKLTF
ncbi:MAG TPA: hybrid sensor histidine kinase/response regulator [Bacteroidales bacterium]|nr:hybrid sensor histidine kinase/response regulator [Bacteroidales bacterium]